MKRFIALCALMVIALTSYAQGSSKLYFKGIPVEGQVMISYRNTQNENAKIQNDLGDI